MIHFDRRAWVDRSACDRRFGRLAPSRCAVIIAIPPPAQPSPPAARGAEFSSRGFPQRESVRTVPDGGRAIQRELSNLCRYTGAEYDALVGLIAAREGVPKSRSSSEKF